MREDRLARLARTLDELPAKDLQRIRKAQELEEWRRQGALALYELAKGFVAGLNRVLTQMTVEFSPDLYEADELESPARNLFQINAQGRVLQITFSASAETASTDHFRTPYILEGVLRWYNQELLDRQEINEQTLFYCLERTGHQWRFYDARKHRTGAVDEEHLVGLLEQLVQGG